MLPQARKAGCGCTGLTGTNFAAVQIVLKQLGTENVGTMPIHVRLARLAYLTGALAGQNKSRRGSPVALGTFSTFGTITPHLPPDLKKLASHASPHAVRSSAAWNMTI